MTKKTFKDLDFGLQFRFVDSEQSSFYMKIGIDGLNPKALNMETGLASGDFDWDRPVIALEYDEEDENDHKHTMEQLEHLFTKLFENRDMYPDGVKIYPRIFEISGVVPNSGVKSSIRSINVFTDHFGNDIFEGDVYAQRHRTLL